MTLLLHLFRLRAVDILIKKAGMKLQEILKDSDCSLDLFSYRIRKAKGGKRPFKKSIESIKPII